MKPLILALLLLAAAAPSGSTNQNIQASQNGWKICTPQGGDANGSSPNSEACGGVGTNQPSAWGWSFGDTMNETVSTDATNGETQILYVYAGPGCDDCTSITLDKWIEPTNNNDIASNELDMYLFDHTHLRKRMFGLQCNQKRGTMQWQIDNVGRGYWTNTGIRDHCPLPSDSYTHIVYTGHWIIGDTGCGGLGCNNYDTLTINDHTYQLGQKLAAATVNPHWRSICGSHDQIDLRAAHGGTITAGRNIQNSSVTCGYSDTSAPPVPQ